MFLLKIIAFIVLIFCGFWSICVTIFGVIGHFYCTKNGVKQTLYGFQAFMVRMIFLVIAAVLAFISYLCYNFVFH